MSDRLDFRIEADSECIPRDIIDKADAAFSKAREILIDTKSTMRERLLADAMIDLAISVPELCKAFNRLIFALEHGSVVLSKTEDQIKYK